MDKIYTILDGAEFDNENAAYKMIFYKTYEIWKEGHNILFADLDTLCIKPTFIFERWHDFAMFWKTDKEDEMFKPYFACGLRYFPKHLAPVVWRQGQQAWSYFEKKNVDGFDNEQLVYNSMLYSQDCHPNYFLRNKLHFIKGFDNVTTEDKAHIIHFPATKGAKYAYNDMNRKWGDKK